MEKINDFSFAVLNLQSSFFIYSQFIQGMFLNTDGQQAAVELVILFFQSFPFYLEEKLIT